MTRTRHLNPRGTIGRRNREGKGSSASKKRSGRVRIIVLDRNLMTRAPATIRWTEKSSVFHRHWKVFSNEDRIGRKLSNRPISKCYHRIIHAGTGIPELTIDQWTNQKILEYHRHVTDIIHGKKNDK